MLARQCQELLDEWWQRRRHRSLHLHLPGQPILLELQTAQEEEDPIAEILFPPVERCLGAPQGLVIGLLVSSTMRSREL